MPTHSRYIPIFELWLLLEKGCQWKNCWQVYGERLLRNKIALEH